MSVTSDEVWSEIERQLFAVVAMVSAKNEARSVGVVYKVRGRKLYFGTAANEWKARHIAGNGSVSLTIPIAKRIPLLPWVKIPAATITFAARARLFTTGEMPDELIDDLHDGLTNEPQETNPPVFVEVEPQGDFVTYGVGVPLWVMRDTERARGRALVS